jgi:hypothetical protein
LYPHHLVLNLHRRTILSPGGHRHQVPKYASGVWWSRWLDLNNLDTRNIVDDYESRRLPLDVLVTDMVRRKGEGRLRAAEAVTGRYVHRSS